MQTTVKETFARAVSGMIADNGDKDTVTCVCEEDIPAGRLLVLGTGYVDGRPLVKLANGSALGELIGVSPYRSTKELREPTTPGDSSTTPPLWKAGDVIGVIKQGRVWVDVVGSAITAKGVALNVRTTAGASRGMVTTTAADSNNVATGLKSHAPSAAGLVIVDLNLP